MKRPNNSHLSFTMPIYFGFPCPIRAWRSLACAVAVTCGLGVVAQAQTASTNIITGSIAVPGEKDVFTFNLTNQARFYFDSLTNVGTLNWTLDGPSGTVINRRAFTSSDGNAAGSVSQLLNPGFYRITVDCDLAATNDYTFRFVDLAAATLLTPGTLVSNALSPANETDLYQFTSGAGDRLFFDRQTLNAGAGVYWRLLDPFGNEVFGQTFNDVTVTQRVAGTYTLLVEGNIGNTPAGGYSFVITPQGNTPPTPFTGTPMNIGQVVSDTLTNASTNYYTFTVASTTRVAVDTLTNSANNSMFLEGPPGTLINNVGLNSLDGSGGVLLLDLTPGDYQLRVRRTAAGTVPYSFRLLDVATATSLTPGTPITGVLLPSTQTLAYRFTNIAGTRYYFDAASTNGPANGRWRLFDPYGALAAQGGINQDQPTQTLPIPGVYTLLMEGWYFDDPVNNAFRFNVVPVSDGVQALTLGAVTAGGLDTPGQRRQYLFNLAAPARLAFDSRTNNSQIRWSLDGPAGNVVNNRTFQSSDSHYTSPFLELPAGDFTLTVSGNTDATGPFSFRLFDTATAAVLTPGLPVSSTLNPPNETDAYRFTAAAGTEMFFDVVSQSGIPTAYWRCVDSFGNSIFAGFLNAGNAGRLKLTVGGNYTLLVEGSHLDATSGSYTINVIPVIDVASSFALGTLVSGEIAIPGQKLIYTFNVPSAVLASFDSRTNISTLRWSLEGPAGSLVANRAFNGSDGSTSSLLNLAAGNYTLTVNGTAENTGAFAFRLFDVASAPPITPGTVVSNILDPANSTAAYRFTAAAGTRLYFDTLSRVGLANLYWRCVDQNGDVVFSTVFSDQGPITMSNGGIYTLLLEGYHTDSGSGTYSFNLAPVTYGEQPLTLGTVVSGAISQPGQEQRYLFSLSSPTTCYFDSLTNNSSLRWSLVGPFGNVVLNRAFTSSDSANQTDPLLPLPAGDYTLIVTATVDNVAAFQFRLFDIATATPFTPGVLVGNTLNPANETDAYRFTANAGDRFFFDWVSATGLPNAYWRLFDPYGNRLFGIAVADAGTNTLLATGTYTLMVEGRIQDPNSGSYQFDVSPRGNVPPVPFTGTPLTFGTTFSGNLPNATTTNDYIFTLSSPAALLFDNLVNADFRWYLNGPGGPIVANRSFQSSDSADRSDALLQLPVGDYKLSVSGLAGNYSFRVLDLATATSFTPGNSVTGAVANTKSTALYRFSGLAGSRYYFDGQPATGFSTAPYVRILSPVGEQLVLQTVTSDADDITLPRAGDYIVSVEGRFLDSGTNGTYAFRLNAIADETNTFLIGQTVTGAITHPGQQQWHRFNLLSAAVLFFDNLENNTLTWTLYGRNGVVISRAFNSSDSVDGVARLALPADDYEILVDAPSATTNTYAFRLVDSSSATSFIPGSTVNGTLTPGLSTLLYRFNANAGDRFYYDGQPSSGFTTPPYVRLYSPLANDLFQISVASDVQVFTAPQTGTYLLAVEGRFNDTSASGNFSFVLQPVVDATNALSVGTVVSNAITVSGQRQFQTFNLPAPTRLFFDSLTNSALRWTLDGPAGTVVPARAFTSSDSVDGDALLDLPAGNYLITIDGTSAVVGGYRFRLLDVANATAFTPGPIYSNSLAPGNSTTLLSFPANAGDRFYYDGLPSSGFTTPPYVSVIAPLGNKVVAPLSIASDSTFTNAQTGVHILAVEGRFQDTSASGNYSFRLVPNPNQPPQPLFDTNVAPDLIVTGVTVTPPSGLQSGAVLTVAWTTSNNGSAATSGNFTERVTIRNTLTSQIISTGTLLYDEGLGGAIAPTGVRPRALLLKLPDGPVSVGNLEVTVTTDALNNVFEQNGGGTGEANNATIINTSATLAPYPDLQVINLQTTPVSAWTTGSVVTISWTITNSGNRTTLGSWTESLIVRNTNTTQIIASITTNYDAALPENDNIQTAGFRDRSLSFTMPTGNNSAGAFEVTVTTDNADELFEYNAGGSAEINNSASLLSYSAVDLRVTGLTATGNPSLQAGASLIVQWNDENQGNVAATEIFYDRIVVRNTNTAEVLLNTYIAYNPGLAGNGAIPPGGTRARQYTYNLPEGTRAVGPIEVTITTDTLNYLPEHNASGTGEANNSSAVVVTVAGTPYPDLVVTSISGPANGLPGQSVPLVWTIQNIGSVAATGSWSDQFFLSADAVIGGDQYLSAVSFTGTLNPGATLTRTQQVTLPTFGAGVLRPVVKTDAGNQIFEENENNNSGIGVSPINLPGALTLSLSPATVSENAGSQASLATLTRNEASAQPLFVTLSNSRPDKVVVPVSVTIPGGASATSFYLGTIDDAIAGTNITAVITAQSTNVVSATNTLTVLENDSPALVLALSAASVLENAPTGSVTATLTRNAGLDQALVATLVSDRPTAIHVPASVTFAIGQTNTSFVVTNINDSLITGTRTVAIYASASGFATSVRTINVLDDDSVSITLQLSQTNANESVVNPAARATITRSPVSSELLRIRLSTNGGSGLQIPAEVYIPADQPAVEFNVNVVDDLLAFGSRTITILAEAEAATGALIPGASASGNFFIQDNDGPTLFVTVPVGVISESGSTSVTIMRNTIPTNTLVANLSLTPAGQASAPATVTFLSGVSSTNITLAGVADGISDGPAEVIVSASAPGFNSGSAAVTVTDIDVPDLAPISLTSETNVVTDGVISVVWAVTNSGLATANGPWVDQVYLATDSGGVNLVDLVAQVTNTPPVPINDSYILSRTYLLPSDPGTYWLVLRSDALNTLVEGSEHNNTIVSAPIVVQPAYRATVSTETNSALSGLPITMTGRTFFSDSGSNAPFRAATVRINKGSFRRLLSVISDANGNFTTVFQPIPGEAGVYTIGADHPRVRQDTVQDQFTLLGMSAVPWNMTLRLAPEVSAVGAITLANQSPLPLTGLTFGTEGLPLGFNVTLTGTNILEGSGSLSLVYDISTTLTTSFQGLFNILITSQEGAVLRIPVNFTVAPPTAQLSAQPAAMNRDMLRGSQSLVSFELINQGGVASGDLTVALPVAPWLSLVSTSTIPSLAPGDQTTLVFSLTPATNLPLTMYSGNLAIVGANAALSVPFNFRAVSEARGDLKLTFTDELTYYAAGAPPVTNATVILRDAITSQVVTNGTSDTNGEVLFLDLPEGNYNLEAAAPQHGLVRGGIHIEPGTTTEQEVFLTRETVRYSWTVVPTQIEDHYRVILQPVFETEVPQPELVVENPVIAPLVIPGMTSQFEIRLHNPGLIALQRVRVPTPSHPSLEITPLVNEIETLPAQSTISVPVTIRVRPDNGGAGGGAGGGCSGTECVVHMPIDTRFRCGKNFVTKSANVELQIVCVPDTGCDFPSVDISRVDFFEANQYLSRAELDCIMGKLDECQKARVRGYLRSGDFGSLDGPFGFGLSDFCACGPTPNIPQLFNFGCQYLESLGFASPSGCPGASGPIPPTGVPVSFGTFTFVAATIPGPCNAPGPLPGGGGGGGANGVCAKIKLEISQDVTMTRSAFRGRLVIENDGSPITGVQINLDFRNAANQTAGDLFGVTGPTLVGLTAADGTGVIAGQSTGSAEYLFVPELEAAPFAPTSYYVGGTLRFIEDGREVTVPLLAAPITVFPEAQLQLDYFQQRDVFADDPFTPELEPSEPFAMGLLVRNTGAGTAHSMQIQSGQPHIIENEKGLINDFRLLGVELLGVPQPSSFDVRFGDIYPGQTVQAIWRMSSSLQGKFIEFSASFEHLDDLGGHNQSLIRTLNVHPLIHLVRADRVGDDSLPDFLVNDLPDPDNLPDAVFLSTGATGAVALATSPLFDGPVLTNDLQVQLTAGMPTGWCYLQITNPGPAFRLVSALRSDGKPLLIGENVWTTDRSFPSSQPGAIREDLLHLFDYDSTGSYTLSFAVISLDTNPPVSAVAALPAISSPTFSVSWDGDDGSDGSGIANFDVFVSVNGAPFTNWLAHTTLNSAIYQGVAGQTYGFYSVATDNAGNTELTPAAADTTTATSAGANTPPSISPVANLTIAEGSKFTFTPTALDSDVPAQTLSYSLPVAPPGAIIDPSSGFMQWQTGEAQGGTTNLFTFVVTDTGLPSLSATQSFSVIVTEVNSAPFFQNNTTEVELPELTLLSFTVAASDSDLPANQLTWSLAPGAPSGMTINSANGLLTWTPTETDGPGEFAVTVTVTDNGIPAKNVSRLLRIVVREANQPPVLAAIPTQATLVQTTLYVTNSATDADLPAQKFFFSLAPGAPRGANVNPTNGLFTWTPSAAYALSSNNITIRVTDDGVPALTASQTFVAVVGDYLEARIGSGIALSGHSNAAPVVIYSTVPATNVVFTFRVNSDRLTNFSLLPPTPPLAAAILTPLGSNQFQVQLRTLAGQTMVGEQPFATLRFDAPTNRPSAFVPVESFNVTAFQADGQPVPRSLGNTSRIICLDRESLLELVPQTNRVDLLVYGRGAAYTVESAATIQPPLLWTRYGAGAPTNYALSLPVITTNTMRFFRAIEGAFQFRNISVNPLTREVSLTLDVLTGRTYELQWSSNFTSWNPFWTNTAGSNVLHATDQPPVNAKSRLYRGVEH